MLMPLNFAKEGEFVEINNVLMNDNIGKKLREMGLNSGNFIEIIKNDGSNIILAIGESRLALDGTIAGRIMIEN